MQNAMQNDMQNNVVVVMVEKGVVVVVEGVYGVEVVVGLGLVVEIVVLVCGDDSGRREALRVTP